MGTKIQRGVFLNKAHQRHRLIKCCSYCAWLVIEVHSSKRCRSRAGKKGECLPARHPASIYCATLDHVILVRSQGSKVKRVALTQIWYIHAPKDRNDDSVKLVTFTLAVTLRT